MVFLFNFQQTGFDQMLKRVQNMGLSFNPEPIGQILESAMAVGFQVSDTKVPVLTGALKASGFFRLISPISAQAIWNIHYALPVETGHRTRGGGGKKVRAQPFIRPGALAAKAELKKLLQSYLKLVSSSVNLVKLPGLKKAPRQRGRPIAQSHRFLTKQITATGQSRFLFPSSTPTGRFTKVFFPGPGKTGLFPRQRTGFSR